MAETTLSIKVDPSQAVQGARLIKHGLDDVAEGAKKFAEKLNDARHQETELGKLFADNNVKLAARGGLMADTNVALGKVAELARNAATEFDKIKIAEAAGLTRDWVPLLEQGAAAIQKQAEAAREVGAVIDTETLGKAAQFEREWNAATTRWAQIFRENAAGIIELLDLIARMAQNVLGFLDKYSRGLTALQKFEISVLSSIRTVSETTHTSV